ncbi:MAG TPA: tripartite tricarboxylate transporter substrate binding protein [Burkholderiaceae bacterium]|nr:tripartite tricarboxylate transporter substrate binding protein [Burkholderiaceae bacterium]
MERRNVLKAMAAIGAVGIGATGRPVGAQQAWTPSKPVRIIVPVAGGTNDLLARLIGPKLSEVLGQPFIVENRPGAGGNIGADHVAKSEPDGHTLLIGYNGPIAVNVTLFKRMPYHPLKDLAPITLMVTAPQVLAVHPSVPADTVAELVRYIKERPGKLSYASIAVGSASHLTFEMFKSRAGLEIVHVPYRGSAPAVTDLLGGQVQAAFLVPGNALPYVPTKQLKLLATTGRKRFQGLPDLPTIAESGYPDFEAIAWIGLLAPAGTPQAAISRYHEEVTKILQMPEIRQKLVEIQFDVIGSTPEQFRDHIRKEIDLWGAVIKQTGATVE